MTDSLGIVDTRKIIEAVKNSFDLDLRDYNLTLLRRRFAHLLSYYNQNEAERFIADINDNNLSKEEFLNEFLIRETEFFRDASFWRDMREAYLPEIAKIKNSSIWVPGTLSGEDVFTLGIVLSELGLTEKINVIASCISTYRTDSIKKGGSFEEKKIEISSSNYLSFGGNKTFENYYQLVGKKAKINTNLLKNVTFKQQNILQEQDDQTYNMIIFRNILIQYTLPLYEKVIKNLIESLQIGGYLILGSKETLEHSELSKKMTLVSETEKIYKKRYN